jgi:serine/threonine-protein kinase
MAVAFAYRAYYFCPMNATVEGEGADDDALRSFAVSRLGQVLGGRWTLTAVLGVGGSACVYAATHRNGARVAIKLLHPELARNARLRRRFLAEGYAANRVGHPGVVVVLDEVEEVNGVAFLVMELLQGQSLDRLLSERGNLPWREVAEMTVAILDVLAAAHDRHVLHRDLKPSNVFLTRGGQVKLLDFGTAKVRTWQGENVITRSGTTLGTPAFMAPELAAGCSDDVDVLTDIWAVGATMFQLLTNRTVHVAQSAQQAIVAAATQPAPRLRSLSEDLPQALADIVDRALAYQKSERFPNARAMQAALRGLLGVPATSTAPDLVTAPEIEVAGTPTRARASRRWLLGALLGVALSVFLTWSRTRIAPVRVLVARAPFARVAQLARTLSRRSSAPPAIPEIVTERAAAVILDAPPRQPPAAPVRAIKLRVPVDGETGAEPSAASEDLLDRWR